MLFVWKKIFLVENSIIINKMVKDTCTIMVLICRIFSILSKRYESEGKNPLLTKKWFSILANAWTSGWKINKNVIIVEL